MVPMDVRDKKGIDAHQGDAIPLQLLLDTLPAIQ